MIENAVEKVEPLNMPIKIGNINTTLLVVSGSVCNILNRSLASQLVQSSARVFWISEKTSKCPDKYFISPIVVTVKKDQTIKLALDSKILNKANHKNDYQIPNIDTLIESISQQIEAPASQNTTCFSTIDLNYAYSQLNLDTNTANHCNFNIISGDMTGTYRFQTGFYGLTDIPAEFQKAMDYTLIGLKKTYFFLDDILMVSKGSLEEHKCYVMNCLKRLDDEKLRTHLPKCHFGKIKIDRLGYHISQLDISPLERKTAEILALEAAKTLKKIRSFLRSVNYIGKCFQNLAQISYPLRPLLKKASKFIWTEAYDNCFNEIKNRIAKATANSHYSPQLATRVKCDASHSGHGAALGQLTVDGWKPIAFTSRFLSSCEEGYSVNELELLGVVWSIVLFKKYLYGKNFRVITDNRALSSIMKENRCNKAYNSRLIRWIDRLLPFEFDIEHLPGAKMGLVDYISRHSSQKAKKVSAYDEEFIVAKLKIISASINSLELNKTKPALHIHQLIKAHDSASQITPKFEAHNPASQITPKTEANSKAINLVSTHAARVYKHDYYISPAPRKSLKYKF